MQRTGECSCRAAGLLLVGAWAALGLGCGEGGAAPALLPGVGPASIPGAPPRPLEQRDGMVLLSAGRVVLGVGDERHPERTGVEVDLASFWIDEREVTRAQFAAFVAATGHVTDAERLGDGVVFHPPGPGVPGHWALEPGATWRLPLGPAGPEPEDGSLPVVLVSLDDARAYARWAGKRLPSEAEWEGAARGGLVGQSYPWGAGGPGADAQGTYPANTWQGLFPLRDLARDGFTGPAPVGSFAANGYGLFDCAGNVWEWVDTPRGSGPLGARHGAAPPGSEPGLDHQIRGGSYLCAASYCQGYRLTERQWKLAEEASNNLGFRCARDGDPAGP
jgi:sulfatase modifying factor 1